MPEPYFDDQTFEGEDYSLNPVDAGEYEQCRFKNCNFAGGDLSGCRFVDCVFDGCNLSNVKLGQTAFRDVRFVHCKMLGLMFDDCQPFGVSFSFEDCVLDHCSFYGTTIKKTVFKDCHLHEADFTNADLSGAVLERCDLLRANFENTNLEKADFSTAMNYALDPMKNKVKKAVFGLYGLPGLLSRFDIVIK